MESFGCVGGPEYLLLSRSVVPPSNLGAVPFPVRPNDGVIFNNNRGF